MRFKHPLIIEMDLSILKMEISLLMSLFPQKKSGKTDLSTYRIAHLTAPCPSYKKKKLCHKTLKKDTHAHANASMSG